MAFGYSYSTKGELFKALGQRPKEALLGVLSTSLKVHDYLMP